jgi:hypothetical protein
MGSLEKLAEKLQANQAAWKPMGGHLDIIARFNEGSVRIAQFEDVGSSHV